LWFKKFDSEKEFGFDTFGSRVLGNEVKSLFVFFSFKEFIKDFGIFDRASDLQYIWPPRR